MDTKTLKKTHSTITIDSYHTVLVFVNENGRQQLSYNKNKHMNITHREIYDKLKIFALAGENPESGWDCSIPQDWANYLRIMGIENPGQWFVADCNGVFPQLRHVGEALFAILHHRSKANKEIVYQAIEDRSYNTWVWELINSYKDNSVANEADAGFVDLNMIIGIITEAYDRGRKSVLVNENSQ